jgi:hypothetical protein
VLCLEAEKTQEMEVSNVFFVFVISGFLRCDWSELGISIRIVSDLSLDS